MRVLTDDDARQLSPAQAVAAMREVLLAHARGEYLSPPRTSTNVGPQRVMFGAGGTSDGAIGLRVSGTAASSLEHVTLTWTASGELDAVIVGNEIGARRTGSVAAVAADLLARPGPVRVGILGSGRNGWAQVWALSGARPIVELSVFSPNPNHRQEFARRARDELDLKASAVATAREAAEDHDVIVLCTTSTRPVIEADWVRDGTHVTSVGPKSSTSHETPEALLGRLEQVVSDAPDELLSPVSDLAGVPLVSLGSLLAAGSSEHREDLVSLFLYSGLGGSDAAYGQAVARLALDDGSPR
jgi:alanine dehydrogenase